MSNLQQTLTGSEETYTNFSESVEDEIEKKYTIALNNRRETQDETAHLNATPDTAEKQRNAPLAARKIRRNAP